MGCGAITRILLANMHSQTAAHVYKVIAPSALSGVGRLRAMCTILVGIRSVGDVCRDTLDPCQSGPPQLLRQSLGMRGDLDRDWEEVARDKQLATHIAERVPVLKAAKLNEVGSCQPRSSQSLSAHQKCTVFCFRVAMRVQLTASWTVSFAPGRSVCGDRRDC